MGLVGAATMFAAQPLRFDQLLHNTRGGGCFYLQGGYYG